MQSPIRIFVTALSFSFLLAMLSGCGGADQPKTVPVTGKVTYNGDAIAGAQVTFRGGGHTALGVTGPDGTFKLSTFGDGDGATLGEKNVTVAKRTTVGSSGSAPGGGMTMDEALAASERGETPEPPKVEQLLPEKYSDPNTSGLKFTVEKGSNNFPIKLTD